MTHKQSSVETDILGIKIMIIYSSKEALKWRDKSQIIDPDSTCVFAGNVYHLVEVNPFLIQISRYLNNQECTLEKKAYQHL